MACPKSAGASDSPEIAQTVRSQTTGRGFWGAPISYWTIVALKWFRMRDWEQLCGGMSGIAPDAVQKIWDRGIFPEGCYPSQKESDAG
jgi:hypothetical protein